MEKLMRLPAELSSLERFREFVLDCARLAAVEEDRIPHIELVLEELITNIVFHAYKEARGDIQVECSSPAGAFQIRITDWSSPFNPLDRPTPDLSASLEERPVGGLGIHLVRQISDGLDYRRENGQNVVEIRFQGATRSA